MTKKNNDTDLQSIINNLSSEMRNDETNGASLAKHEIANDAVPEETNSATGDTEQIQFGRRLWTEFCNCLNSNDEEYIRSESKRYALDEDIIATLHQCDFGKPNVDVINSILRVFLTDNIPHLRKLAENPVKSILDVYNQ